LWRFRPPWPNLSLTALRRLRGTHELELDGGKLFGNIFTTRAIVQLDPTSGCIDGIADLSVLWRAMSPEEKAAVDTNGIAYEGIDGNVEARVRTPSHACWNTRPRRRCAR
jgi:Glutamine cyclotransferase